MSTLRTGSSAVLGSSWLHLARMSAAALLILALVAVAAAYFVRSSSTGHGSQPRAMTPAGAVVPGANLSQFHVYRAGKLQGSGL
jgi:hypothetical protein